MTPAGTEFIGAFSIGRGSLKELCEEALGREASEVGGGGSESKLESRRLSFRSGFARVDELAFCVCIEISKHISGK